MAAADPVVIYSSDHELPLRALSLTPPSVYKDTTSILKASSSPRLPSPGRLVPAHPKLPLSKLKSGSNAKSIPKGALAGFSSTKILYESPYFQDVSAEGDDASHTKVCATKRSRKASVTANERKSGKRVKVSGAMTATDGSGVVYKDSEQQDVGNHLTLREQSIQRHPSVMLAALSQDVPAIPNAEVGAVTGYPILEEHPRAIEAVRYCKELEIVPMKAAARKPRKKRHSSALDQPKQTPPKKATRVRPKSVKASDKTGQSSTTTIQSHTRRTPGNPTYKSVSLVLNSDEPEPVLVESTPEQKRANVPPVTLQNGAQPQSQHICIDSSPNELHTDSTKDEIVLGAGTVEADFINLEHNVIAQPCLSHDEGIIQQLRSENGVLGALLDCQDQNLDTEQIQIRRRRAWTPVEDTRTTSAVATDNPHGSAEIRSCDNSSTRLFGVLQSLAYVSPNAKQVQTPGKSISGNPVAKTRESSAAQSICVNSVARQTPASKSARRVKSIKKVKTITALATAAYKRATLVDAASAEQIIDMPNLKLPPTTINDHDTRNEENEQNEAKQMTKPRKARNISAKRINADISKPKSTKRKKKQEEVSPQQNLYSPSHASARINRQNFLFGTSSQLAIDESSAYVRDVQLAILQSEDLHPESIACGANSMSKFSEQQGPPLVVEGSKRIQQNMWRVAARGRDGGLFRHRKLLGDGKQNQPLGLNAIENKPDLKGREIYPSNTVPANEETEPNSGQNDNGILCFEPLMSQRVERELPEAVYGDLAPSKQSVVADEPEQMPQNKHASVADTSWFVLPSDTSTSSPVQPAPSIVSFNLDSDSKETKHTLSISPSKRFLPSARSPLRLLDANAGISMHMTTEKATAVGQKRLLSMSPSRIAKNRKALARPRGRPRKDAASANLPPVELRKNDDRELDDTIPNKNTSRKTTKRSAAMLKSAISGPSDAQESEDISDSDIAPTPSPPRRGQLSPVPTAQLKLENTNKSKPKRPEMEVAELTNGELNSDVQWTSFSKSLFPRITTTVKSQSRQSAANDAASLTWWDKILLYDPIDLEEFTTWLSLQGLEIRVAHPKSKPKRRGRKGKEVTMLERPNAEELELHSVDLKPWMVRKWCEAHSICCFQGGNGWHGPRKGRY